MARRDEEPWTQLATRIPKELHRRLKLHRVTHETAVQDFVVAALGRSSRGSRGGSGDGQRRDSCEAPPLRALSIA